MKLELANLRGLLAELQDGAEEDTKLRREARGRREALKTKGGGSGKREAVPDLVERFDRRGTEPFELFRSEFGQNCWNP